MADGDEAGWERVLSVLRHFDVAAPLEHFDEMLMLVADRLQLRHIQYARVDPTCDRGRVARVALDDAAECSRFARRVEGCSSQRKACAPELARACAEAVRRVAPMDHRLYEHVRARFKARLASLGAPFARRVQAFKAQTVGVFVGGTTTLQLPARRAERRAARVPRLWTRLVHGAISPHHGGHLAGSWLRDQRQPSSSGRRVATLSRCDRAGTVHVRYQAAACTQAMHTPRHAAEALRNANEAVGALDG